MLSNALRCTYFVLYFVESVANTILKNCSFPAFRFTQALRGIKAMEESREVGSDGRRNKIKMSA